MNAAATPQIQVGGAVDPTAQLYLLRDADEDLARLLKAHEFVNVVTSRQMGKTSLVFRAITQLGSLGFRSAYFDLSPLRNQANALVYYKTVVREIARSLAMEELLDEFWAQRTQIAPSQGFIDFFRVVLARSDSSLIVVLDEIDSTLELDFTDDLFAAIRNIYVSRPLEPAFKRLAFCLVGVAAPNELIKSGRTTPYNVGTTLWLRDFDPARDNIEPLAGAIHSDPALAAQLLERVFHWTAGQPYLTAWLCRELQRKPVASAQSVDALVEGAFTTLEQVRHDSHFDQTLRFISDRTRGIEIINLYGQILSGGAESDQAANLIYSHLKLSGLVKVSPDGSLVPRNRIYERLFTAAWVEKSRAKLGLDNQRDSVVHYRSLANAHPHQHLPQLVRKLAELFTALTQAGLEDEAREVEQEIRDRSRDLAATGGELTLRELALTLRRLGRSITRAAAPERLIIRHLHDRQFTVLRTWDAKSWNAVELVGPDEITVPERSGNLLTDLSWYLERFLDYPFDPATEVAERVQRTLREWGAATFARLFTDQSLAWYDAIRATGLEHLELSICSNDPHVLAWPWEALCDGTGTTLAHSCRLIRQLHGAASPPSLPDTLSITQLNVLMVIARPTAEDEEFHAVSAMLIELANRERAAVRIDMLRPATFAALEARLHARPGYYHIVHFDCLGGRGEIMLEDEAGATMAVAATRLAILLTERPVPIVVLSAGRSASVDARMNDAAASTAATLLMRGVRSVVAMTHDVYISGLQQFVPAFYRRLLETGDVAEATRSGRAAMLLHDKRACVRGEYPLQDWLVPVLYQQEVVALPAAAGRELGSRVPREQLYEDYELVGRSDAIYRIERAVFNQPAASVLIHGMAGIGKTKVAMGFINWMQQTGGISSIDDEPGSNSTFLSSVWISFDAVRSVEYVVNHLVECCSGLNAIPVKLPEKLALLTKALREQPRLLIWDNLESASGIENTDVAPLLTESDRSLLKDFLQQLRGGRSKVLITSRSPENWLTPIETFRVPLRGLRERHAEIYCNAVLRDLGLAIERKDQDIQDLLEELDGHPLALRSVLLRLGKVPAKQLRWEMMSTVVGQPGDASTQRIRQSLAVLNARLPRSFVPVLELIALHQRHVDLNHVADMLTASTPDARPEAPGQCFTALECAGLLHHVGTGVYSMHPALRGCLVSSYPAQQQAVDQFVGFMARYAEQLARSEWHEQRVGFASHNLNLQHALALATQLPDVDPAYSLSQSLATIALNSRDLAMATGVFETIATRLASAQPDLQAAAFHRLGILARKQRDFAAAEHWYAKSLAISEDLGQRLVVASTYHELGNIAQERRDFATAERWYLKSLALEEKQGNDHGAALSCHQLGIIAHQQREFAAAERWYLKSLAIEERQLDEHGAATTCHQLGTLAQQRRDFAAAEHWYLKSLALKEKQGDEHGAAGTYHHLGIIAQQQRDFAAAERWHLKALAIREKQGDEHGLAMTYHQIGMIAAEQRDLVAAERWCLKSLAIKEKHGNEAGAASTYQQLGIVAQEQGDLAAAERWYLKSLAIKERQGNEYGAALTFGALGQLSLARADYLIAGDWFAEAARVFAKQQVPHFRDIALSGLSDVLTAAPAPIRARLVERCKALDVDVEQLGDPQVTLDRESGFHESQVQS